MKSWVLGLVVATAAGTGFGVGCAAGNDPAAAATGGGSAASAASGTGGLGIDAGDDDGGLDEDAACAKFTDEATASPAAMLIVLDRSASMNTSGKWSAAQLAIVSAIDKDVFDTMSLGLVTFPAIFGDPPACLCQGLPIATCKGLINGGNGIACGITALPQVAMNEAGLLKSGDGSGVRSAIYDYLATTGPVSDESDSSPIYDALVAGYNALKAYDIDKRILVLVSDGGFSCTSVSANPVRPGYSDGACPDWEYPSTVNALITAARADAEKPINTFIVGVPGSDSTGANQGAYATAPYSMKLALSTYAVSGSPETVDPGCDAAAVFDQAAPPPAAPCHIDLSSGTFDADALADAITAIRGKALGCTYELPAPPPGESIDLGQVNVRVTLDGTTVALAKRADPSDTCEADGCWDYGAGDPPPVQILGKTCADLGAATEGKVEILVGCATIVK
jgi:hypothetical protein